MAQINLTIPDAQLQRIIDGVCGRYKYDASSGFTKPQFVKQKIGDMIKNAVLAYEVEVVRTTAEEQTRASIQSIDIS